MACPCFFPVEPLPPSGKQRPPAPLGDRWTGLCCAGAETGWMPDPVAIREICNFGYAAGKCPRFPAGGPDAVRFTISHDQAGLIRIYWVVEKSHLPFAHGPLEYSRTDACFTVPHPDAAIARQAQAYISSYLRRIGDDSSRA